jgi:hypothetical protein
VFGAYHLYESGEVRDTFDSAAIFPFLKDHTKWVGWGLIIFGIIILSEKLLFPHISWEMQGYLRTGVVALLFILGGIQLLRGQKNEIPSPEKEESPCEPGE